MNYHLFQVLLESLRKKWHINLQMSLKYAFHIFPLSACNLLILSKILGVWYSSSWFRVILCLPQQIKIMYLALYSVRWLCKFFWKFARLKNWHHRFLSRSARTFYIFIIYSQSSIASYVIKNDYWIGCYNLIYSFALDHFLVLYLSFLSS